MSKVTVPRYTVGEEITNAVTHGLGALLAIAGLVLTVVFSAKHHNPVAVVSSCIYGVSMIVMFTMSCLYHSFSPKILAKKVFRVIDHCDIYIYIAGCYTPYCLCILGGTRGWVTFAAVWACAVIGIIINAIDLERFGKLSMFLYLFMGWMVLFSFKDIYNKLEPAGFWLLLIGGVVYTIGAVLYGIGAKVKYFHSIFHVFIVAASVLQFLSILLFVV